MLTALSDRAASGRPSAESLFLRARRGGAARMARPFPRDRRRLTRRACLDSHAGVSRFYQACAALVLTACYGSHGGRPIGPDPSDAGWQPDARLPIDAPADATGCGDERCNGADDDCDGVVDESSDGDCYAPGGTGHCWSGGCALECDAGRADCDADLANGCEVDLSSDRHHCGECAVACAEHWFCREGACEQDVVIDVDPALSTHACLVVASGAVHCWGRNEHGLISTERPGEIFTTPMVVEAVPRARAVEVGDSHACVIALDGVVHCWGSNLGGRLGQGHGGALAGVVPVSLPLPAESLVADVAYTCALLSDGSAWCFGVAIDGSSLVPVAPARIEGLPPARALVALAQGMCAIDRDGGWWCWGNNVDGQFALPSADRHIFPPVRGTIEPLESAMCGAAHCCGVFATGRAACWGWNYSGQMGVGYASDEVLPPTTVSPPADVQAVGAASTSNGSASCAVTGAGELWCWGRGADGLNALGGIDAPTPAWVAVAGPPAAQRLWSNWGGTCLQTGPRSIRCWGRNESGQIGDGSTSVALIPTSVATFE